jgi:hypothetical protein
MLPDVVTVNAGNRIEVTKDLRVMPEVEGNFRHIVAEIDRLDHLAFKYYKQPTKWWRICDANPDFMSPQALLGVEPIEVASFPLIFTGAAPPWTDLVRRLEALVGVEDVKVVEDSEIVAEQQTVGGQTVMVNLERFTRAAIVTYNRTNLGAGQIAGVIETVGFEVAEPQRIGRVGKEIVIPLDAAGSRS